VLSDGLATPAAGRKSWLWCRRQARYSAPLLTEELQFAGAMGVAELFEEQPSEQSREHAHGQEEARSAGDPL